MNALIIATFCLAALPLLLCLWNFAVLRRTSSAVLQVPVSILIPARNEAANIAPAVHAALAALGDEGEVVVLDDHSEDDTAAQVMALAAQDRRIRLERAPPLPAGWSGKQHACWQLARHARFDEMLFVDADVLLSPAAAGRMVAFRRTSGAALVSGFPHQVTISVAEKLVIPMILVLLVGYLPMWAMRHTRSAGLAAACGQLILVQKSAYFGAGGHVAIRASLHDGITLPRAFRKAGFMTDLCDATDLAACRMYAGWRDAWNGFLKNATEGMATPLGLPVWTVLLMGGHVVPLFVLIAALLSPVSPAMLLLAVLAAVMPFLLRLLVAQRFGHPASTVAWHPIGILVTLAIQWVALSRKLCRRPTASWRGRDYST